MSEMPYYPPMASAPRQAGAAAPGPILFAAPGPAAQRRATVAVRLILALPHLIALYFLGIAAFAIAFIGWFGALAAGRLPRFAFTFLAGYLRWFARVQAYLLLLTDAYPPFALEEDPAYPVRLAASPGRLNRVTVAFRVITAIPAAIVATLLTSGFVTIMVFVAWLTALIAGQLPASLHQAFTAVLRYTLRYYGYLYLLTDVYPAGLFGDPAGIQPESGPPLPGGPGYWMPGPGQAPPAGYGPPVSYEPPTEYGPTGGYQGYRPPGYAVPAYGVSETRSDAPAPEQDTVGYGMPGFGAPGYGTPAAGTPGYAAPGAAAPGLAAAWIPPAPGPASWELILSAKARRLVGLVLLLGLLTAVGEGAWTGTVVSAAIQRHREISQLNTDVALYNVAVGQFNTVVAQHNSAVIQEQQAADEVNAASTALNNAQNSLDAALNSPGANANNCQSVACFNTTAQPVVNAFAAFGRTLNSTAVPAGSAAIKSRLLTDTANDQKDWTEITQATSFSSIASIATNAETVGEQFDNDTSALGRSLNNEATALDNQGTTLSNAAPALNAKAARLSEEGRALNHRAVALNVSISLGAPEQAL